jgi:hypothetical protein
MVETEAVADLARISSCVADFEERIGALGAEPGGDHPVWQPTELRDFLANLHTHRAVTHRRDLLSRITVNLRDYNFSVAHATPTEEEELSAVLLQPPPPTPGLPGPDTPPSSLRPPSPHAAAPSLSPAPGLDLLRPTPVRASSSHHGDAAEIAGVSQWLHAVLRPANGATTEGLARFMGLLQAETAPALIEEAVLLFLAIVPTRFQAKLVTVPQLGMLFRNDCAALAHHLCRRGPDGSFIRYSLLLSRLASKTFLLQRDIQAASFQQILQECDFSRLRDEAARARLTGLLKRLKLEFRRLATSLELILPETLFSQLLVDLLDHILAAIVLAIRRLPEITEVECDHLAVILQSFDDYPQVLGPAAPAIHTTAGWLRLQKLRVVLRSSLAEIMDLYHSGDLEEFSPDELRRLITALFAETPFRARQLETIGD